ncbi:MAG: uracil-DNA glycosylase family protein [Gammaproteobacteria bacterium]|nr:uracil-DNA glycosylase family protein [Gammaproteobacteria bacterium]
MSELSPSLHMHQQAIRACCACPLMQGPPVTGAAVESQILLVGQAPGTKEIEVHRPFAWTAGKTLFNWFAQAGIEEEPFREQVYMAAVCRCFPGKNPRGGDRVPNQTEIQQCSRWLDEEIRLLKPRLILPVGKLAISQFMPVNKLVDIIGRVHRGEKDGHPFDLLPFPHPSGASTWHRTEPGKTLLHQALGLLATHPAWQQLS